MGLLVKNVRKHKKTGRVDYRRTFPVPLRPFLPEQRSSFLRSLGAEGSPGFLSRYEAAEAEYAALETWAKKKQAGAFDKLDTPMIAWLAETYYVRWSEKTEKIRWTLGGSGWSWGHAQRGAILSSRNTYMAIRANGDTKVLLEKWGPRAVEFAAECGLLIDPSDIASLTALCRQLNDAAIRVAEDDLQKRSGKTVRLPVEAPRPRRGPKKADPTALSILGLFDASAVHMTPGVRSDLRRNIQHLIKFLGHDDANRLTTHDVMRWRDALLVEPGLKGKPRDPVTVRGKFVGSLKAMLNWAVQEMKLPANVAATVMVKAPKKAKLRQSDFTDEEARKILAASLVPAPTRMSPGHALARRWIPWLCAYTGARVNEMSQLRGADVYQIDGQWVLRITPEAGTVKSKEARIVPLHPHLIDQGFPAAARIAGEAPMFYAPANTRVPKDGNRHSKKVGERLAKWVREEVGIKDLAIKPNHGWRHLFKTRCYSAGIQKTIADAIQGHAPTDVSQSYGSITVATKAEAIKSLPRFEVAGA